MNEGVSTFFEYLLVHKVHPDLRVADYFNVNKVHNAMNVDALESTNTLTAGADTNNAVMYDKGKSFEEYNE